jgi:hypothetical protein
LPSLESRPVSRGLSVKKISKDLSLERAPDPFFSVYSQPLPQLQRAIVVNKKETSKRFKLINAFKFQRRIDVTSALGPLAILNETQNRLSKAKNFISLIVRDAEHKDNCLPPIEKSSLSVDTSFLAILPINSLNLKPKFAVTPRLIRTIQSRSKISREDSFNSYPNFAMFGNSIEKIEIDPSGLAL